ncbi:ABC transporter ATP-binding protein [Nocardia bovistercoris]|uniref:ATP-binding cassette domain-containing protein n=1 Tax=Nocardia bovistercoris TaxID=2785916 RepID=A0A931I6M4_9NOCA|nr:ATP-binding cassette domain-containing protein [Nocardia bovistercoris]MBH0775844.1 ATP-binding cassette domain-containing protein [Nocardia bovistercoris]
MSAARPAIAVHGLGKRYELDTVVDKVGFEVAAGTCTALVGPAGAGKSTILRILLGLVRPTTGTASVGAPGAVARIGGGAPVGGMLTPRGLHPARSARDHLTIYAAAARVPETRVEELLDTVGMTEHADQRAEELSAGQQTRIGLATALLADPPLLILDEPTDGLEAPERTRLHDFLRGHVRRGGTVLVASRSLAAVVPAADDLVVLSEGAVVYTGTPAKLRRGHPDRIVVSASVPVALATMLAARGYTDTVIRPDGRLAIAEATETQIQDAARAAGVRLDAMTPDPIHPDRVLAALTTPRTATPRGPAYLPPAYPQHPVAPLRQPMPYGIQR